MSVMFDLEELPMVLRMIEKYCYYVVVVVVNLMSESGWMCYATAAGTPLAMILQKKAL